MATISNRIFKNTWFVTDDFCGLVCANSSVFLVALGQLIISKILLNQFGFGFFFVIFSLGPLLAIISHTRCQFTDPGTVPLNMLLKNGIHDLNKNNNRNQKNKEENDSDNETVSLLNNEQEHDELMKQQFSIQLCQRCNSAKPNKAHHCGTCRRCILRMDHHCPQVNNCVGFCNQKYFLLFLFQTFTSCLISCILIVIRFFTCATSFKYGFNDDYFPNSSDQDYCRLPYSDFFLGFILIFIDFLFGIFTFVMMCDQISSIVNNTPAIDKLQNKIGEQRSSQENIKSVFGEPFSWRQFLPLDLSKQMQQDQVQLRLEIDCRKERKQFFKIYQSFG